MLGLHRRKRQLGACALLLGALLQPILAAAPDVDLLDLPAKRSRNSQHALMLAVTLAGKRLVTVGERGVVKYSDDQGRTWTQADVPVSVMLTSVYFVNEQMGWAVGHDGVVLRSADGGKTWIKQFDGNKANALVRADAEARVEVARGRVESARAGAKQQAQQALERAQSSLEEALAGEKFGPSRPFLGVWFRDQANGFVAGSYGQIFRTRNSGESWEYIGAKLSNPDGLHYNMITGGPSGCLLMAGEAGRVYRSTNDGESWQVFDTGYKGQLYGVIEAGQPGRDGVLVTFGFGGRIFRSQNDGRTWEQVGAGLKSVPLVAGITLNNGTILVTAQDGAILSSDDDGMHFAVVADPGSLPVAAMTSVLGDQPAVALAGIGGVRLVELGKSKAGGGGL